MALTSKKNSPSSEGELKNQENDLDSNNLESGEDTTVENKEDNQPDDKKGKEDKKSQPKTIEAQKQSEKVTLQHPTAQPDGTVGLYLPNGDEISVPVKKGEVTLTHKQYDIRDVLIANGYIDKTTYSNYEQEITVELPEPKKIKKASFFHPDANENVPINAEIGIYLNNGEERKVVVKKNVITVTDQDEYESLVALNFPTGEIEYL